MERALEITEESQKPERHSLSVLGWVAIGFVVYLALTGPDLMMNSRRQSAPYRPVFTRFTWPAAFLYLHTPLLQKPLGLYWRMWDPAHFDDKGQIIFYVVPD